LTFLFLKNFFKESDIEFGFSKFYSLEGPKKLYNASPPDGATKRPQNTAVTDTQKTHSNCPQYTPRAAQLLTIRTILPPEWEYY